MDALYRPSLNCLANFYVWQVSSTFIFIFLRRDGRTNGRTERRMDRQTDEEYFTPIATHLTLQLSHGRTHGGRDGQTGYIDRGTDGRTRNILHVLPPTSPYHLPTVRRMDGWTSNILHLLPPTSPSHLPMDGEYFTPIATHRTLPLAHGWRDGRIDGRTDGWGMFYTYCHPPHPPTCPPEPIFNF